MRPIGNSRDAAQALAIVQEYGSYNERMPFYLGSGCSRVALSINGIVYKVECGWDGANLAEAGASIPRTANNWYLPRRYIWDVQGHDILAMPHVKGLRVDHTLTHKACAGAKHEYGYYFCYMPCHVGSVINLFEDESGLCDMHLENMIFPGLSTIQDYFKVVRQRRFDKIVKVVIDAGES